MRLRIMGSSDHGIPNNHQALPQIHTAFDMNDALLAIADEIQRQYLTPDTRINNDVWGENLESAIFFKDRDRNTIDLDMAFAARDRIYFLSDINFMHYLPPFIRSCALLEDDRRFELCESLAFSIKNKKASAKRFVGKEAFSLLCRLEKILLTAIHE